jgi:phosphoglucosamine mutase
MLFGSSGIRKLYDSDLVEIALKVGSVLATHAGTIVIGRDSRRTGPVLANCLISGIMCSGGNVRDGGIAPTPSVAVNARFADAGCSITASHNPEPYNGLKLINSNGSSYTKRQQEEVESLIDNFFWHDWEHQGRVDATDLIGPHMDAIRECIDVTRARSFVVDCGNGAGSVITPSLLASLGLRTTCINCNVSAVFSRPSEPLETNVPYIGEIVRSTGADGGIVHDGDADRMMALDDEGRYISGDHLLMLFTRYLGVDKVVTTVDASMAIEEEAEVHRTPVGDSFVSEELLRWGQFGGEPSGSWIFPEHTLCPDGIYAAALFCEIASEWRISEEIESMPSYPLIRISRECPDPAGILTRLGASNPTDGIRFAADDGWCLIRASGTEPKIRITAEGKTRERAKALAEEGLALLRKGNTDNQKQ